MTNSALADLWVKYILIPDSGYDFYMCPAWLKVEVSEKLIAMGRMDLVTEEYGGTLPNVKPGT